MHPEFEKAKFEANVEGYWAEVASLTRVPEGAQKLRARLKQVDADASIVHVPPARLAHAIDEGWTEKEFPVPPSDDEFQEWLGSLRTAPDAEQRFSDLL